MPRHVRVKVVWCGIGFDVCVPDVPVHESPLSPVTVHAFVLVLVHTICTVSPALTMDGRADRETAGGAGARHALPEQPKAQCCTRSSMH
jgi:hypothetical protein